MHISSSYAKILGETNFQPREFPRSRSKEKDGIEQEDRTLVITMASYALQTPPQVAHAKPPGPITFLDISSSYDKWLSISGNQKKIAFK